MCVCLLAGDLLRWRGLWQILGARDKRTLARVRPNRLSRSRGYAGGGGGGRGVRRGSVRRGCGGCGVRRGCRRRGYVGLYAHGADIGLKRGVCQAVAITANFWRFVGVDRVDRVKGRFVLVCLSDITIII